MTFRPVFALTIALAASLVLLACPPGPPPTDVVIDIPIGVSSSGGASGLGRTPGLAAWALSSGHWLYDAVRLAVDQATRDGTIDLNGHPARVKLILVDDQGDPARANQIARELVAEGVVAVIGHLTPETALAAAPIYAEAHVLYMSPVVSSPELTAPEMSTTLLMQPDPYQVTSASARAVYYTLDGRRAALFMQADDFYIRRGKMWAEMFGALGGEVVFITDVPAEASDAAIKEMLAMAARRDAQAIVYSGGPELGARLAQTAHAMRLPQRIVGFEELIDERFLELANAQAEGTIAFAPGLGERSDIYRRYQEIAANAQVSATSPDAPYAYDAARFVLEAVKSAASNKPAAVSDAARGLETDGLTGLVAFLKDGRRQVYQVTLYEATPAGWVDKATLTQQSDSTEPGEVAPNEGQELPTPIGTEPTEDAREALLDAYRRLRELSGFRYELNIQTALTSARQRSAIVWEAVPTSDYTHIIWEPPRADGITEAVWIQGESYVYQDDTWRQADPEVVWPLARLALIPDESLEERLSDTSVSRTGPTEITIGDRRVQVWVYTADARWQGKRPARLTVLVDAENGWPLSTQWVDRQSGRVLATGNYFDHGQGIEIIRPRAGGMTTEPSTAGHVPKQPGAERLIPGEVVVDYQAGLSDALERLSASESFHIETRDRASMISAEVIPSERYAHGIYVDIQRDTEAEFLLIGDRVYERSDTGWKPGAHLASSESLWQVFLPASWIMASLLPDPPVTREGPISDEGQDFYAYSAQMKTSPRTRARVVVYVGVDDNRPVRIVWFDAETEEILRKSHYFDFDVPVERVTP
ncbi:MAG: branched-chain amino acid ABC transporter substrate-binding protein [Anaerolineae bacterium]|nr:branched-chain amino acid ABC transporter substrate-binding protein [Anaerolineae bacterium]